MSQQQHDQLVGSFHETLDNILANEGELGRFLDFCALHENLTFANKVTAFAAVPDSSELHTRQEWWQLYGRRVAGKARGTVLFSFDESRRYVVGKTERYFSADQVYAPDGETRTLTDWEQIAIHAPAVLEAIGALEEGEQIAPVPEDEYAAVRKIVDKGLPEASAFEKNASAYMICKRLGLRPSLAEFGLEGVAGLDKAAFRRAMTGASRCLFEVAQSAVGSYNALVAEMEAHEAERERVESLEKSAEKSREEKIEAREGLGNQTVEHYDNVGQLDADKLRIADDMTEKPSGGSDEGGNLEAEQEPERVHGASGLDRGVRASATELPVGREARPLRGDDAGQQAAGAPRADGGLLQGRGAEGGAGEARTDAPGRARTRGEGLDGLHRQGEQRLYDAQAGADARSGDGRSAAAADLRRGVEQGGEGQTQPGEEKIGAEERGEALYLPGLSEPIYQTPGPLPVYRLLLDDGEESGTRTWVNLAKGDWAEGLERAWSWSIEHASTEGYPLKGSDVYAWYEGGELVTNSDVLYATPVEAFVSFAYNCKELAKENILGIDFAEAVRKTDGFSVYWYARSIGAQLDYSPVDNGWVVTPKASELAESADEAERLVWEAAERESGLYNTATGKTYILDLGGSGSHGVLFHGVQVAETPVESLYLEDGSYEDASVFALENYNAPGASAGMGFVAEDFLIEMVPGWSEASSVLTEITREIAESPQDWCLADGAAIAANIEQKEAVRVESRAKAAERVALSPDMPLDVVLHDPENGLYVKLQYLDDNSYADYDIAVYDINGHEITTSAAGLGWEDAEDEDSWEPQQTYTFAEVAEVVNDELKGNWPTLFSAADAEIVAEEEADRLLELFGDQDAEEMEYIREHSREEVMARRYERAVYAARVFGVEGWQPSRGLTEVAGLDGRIRMDSDGRMDGLDGRTDLDGFGRTVEGQNTPGEEKGSEGQEQPREEKGVGEQEGAAAAAAAEAEPVVSVSPLLELLAQKSWESHAFGNDGMYFVETLADLEEMGFTEADLADLEDEVYAHELDTVIEASPAFADNGDPIITCYGGTFEAVERVKRGEPSFDGVPGLTEEEQREIVERLDVIWPEGEIEAKHDLMIWVTLAATEDNLVYQLVNNPNNSKRQVLADGRLGAVVTAELAKQADEPRYAELANNIGAYRQEKLTSLVYDMMTEYAGKPLDRSMKARVFAEHEQAKGRIATAKALLKEAAVEGVPAEVFADVVGVLAADARLANGAKINSKRDFQSLVEDRLADALVEGYEQHEAEFNALLSNEEDMAKLAVALTDYLYPMFNGTAGEEKDAEQPQEEKIVEGPGQPGEEKSAKAQQLSLLGDDAVQLSEQETLIREALLYGTGYENGKNNVMAAYARSKSSAGFTKAVKELYGLGGGFPVGEHGYVMHSPSKGFSVRKSLISSEGKVTLSWSDVSARLSALIEEGVYLNSAEKTAYEAWKAKQEQEKIVETQLEEEKTEQVKGDFEVLPGTEVAVEKVDPTASLPGMRNTYPTSFFGGEVDVVYSAEFGKEPLGGFERTGRLFIVRDAARAASGEAAWKWRDASVTTVAGSDAIFMVENFDPALVNPEHSYSTFYENPQAAYADFCRYGELSDPKNNLAGIDFKSIADELEKVGEEKGEEQPGEEKIEPQPRVVELEGLDSAEEKRDGAYGKREQQAYANFFNGLGINVTHVDDEGLHEYKAEDNPLSPLYKGDDVRSYDTQLLPQGWKWVVDKSDQAKLVSIDGEAAFTATSVDMFKKLAEHDRSEATRALDAAFVTATKRDVRSSLVKLGYSVDNLEKLARELKQDTLDDFYSIDTTAKSFEDALSFKDGYLLDLCMETIEAEKEKEREGQEQTQPREEKTEKVKGSEAEKAASEVAEAAVVAGAASRGPKQRYRDNVAAIKVLGELEKSGKEPTAKQAEILSKYVGWGGLSKAFDANDAGWAAEYAELKGLLSEEEYSAARESTLTSFYTPPTVVQATWDALSQMGFEGGRVLEPAMGTGRFVEWMPEDVREASEIHGVEKDSLSGRLAAALHGDVDVQVKGYEEVKLEGGSFDLAVSNVPFGDIRPYDPEYGRRNYIHDYYFDKTIDKVRPGGIVAFITSTGTMDKANNSVRYAIAQRAELLGAVRLPSDTFKGEAGTEASSDIIFLKKRATPVENPVDSWVRTVDVDGMKLNAYYMEHPEMVLGEMTRESGPGGRVVQVCKPRSGHDLASELKSAMAELPVGVFNMEGNVARKSEAVQTADGRTLVAAPEDARKYSYVVKDGEVYYHGTDGMMELQSKLNAADKERVIAMCSIRDALRALNHAEADAAAPEEYLDGLRAELNRVYDAYVDNTKLSGGSVHKYLNKVFKKDSSAVLLDELEEVHEERDASGKKVTVVTPKAAKIFEKRTVYPPVNIEHADSLEDALAISLAETGAVDIARMAELVGMSETDVTEQGRGSVFFWDVESDAYVPSDEYLSGHIAAKIEVAKAHAAATGEDMGIEIEALEANKPPKVEAADIAVELGAPWVPVDMVRKFMYETFRTPFHYQVDRAYDPVDLVYSPNLNRWTVVNATRDVRSDVAETQYGTSERSSYQLFEDALNLKNTVVHKTVYDRFYETKKVVDPEATAAAQAKQELIREAFRTWVVATPERRATIEEEYNKRFNAIKLREFDPRSVKLVGANAEIELEQHQLAAVARQLYGGNTLLYHSVGAGKTFEMAAACQEGKRIGLHNKAMIVVPNHLPSQFAKEYLTLYPDANILVTGDDDYSPKKLEATLAKIAMGEWDAVIVGFSKFEKIKVSPQTQMNYLNHRRAEIMAEIDEVKSSEMGKTARNRTVKELEKMRANAEAKIRALEGKLEKKARVEVLSFEELGIDRLFIDEAHYFKNLAVTTSMTRMRGISSQGSVKCEDLYMKLQWLNEKTGYRGVTFATGTAISNTLTEMYVMQQYLAPQELERMGLMSFDAWAGTFAKKETVIEIPPEATGYRAVERMSKFQNLPELMVSFKSFADVKTAEQLDLPLPELIREDIGIKPNQFQKDYVQHLAERAEHLRQCGGRDGKDNMLCVTNDGRKLGLDPRLIDPSQPQPAGGKVETAAELLLRNYADYNSFGRIATQMVFCDMSTPVVGREFSVYNALKETLAAGMTVNVLDRAEDGSKIAVLDENGEPLVDEKGNTVWSRHPEFVSIPADEIRYIHEAGDKEAEKQAMFDEFNEGRIKVLMGSTARMGAGTNAQRHLKALIHMDCQWRPSDMEQREGRIHRRGNEWKDDALDPGVIVSRLVTQGTFDSYMYQTVEAKAKFITQIFTDRAPARAAEDIDERALNYAEVKALAAGNPEIKEKMELDAEVARLERDQRLFNREQFALEKNVKVTWPARVKSLEGDAANMRADAKAALPKPEKDMAFVTINGVTYTGATEAGDAIARAAMNAYSGRAVEMGLYRGFELSAIAAWGRDRVLRLQGNGIYEVELGKSIGNITRLDNIIDNLEKRAETAGREAAELRAQIDELSGSIGETFPKQAELDAARKRLGEIEAKLNLGENTHTAVSADEKDDEELNTESQGYTFDKEQVRAINRARGEEGKSYGGGYRPPKCLGLSAEQIAAFGRPEVPAYWMERMADTIYNASDKDKMAESLAKYVTADFIEKYNAYEDLVALAFAIERDVNLQQMDSFDYKRVYIRAAAQFVGATDSEMIAWFASLSDDIGSDNWKNQALRLSEHGKEIMELFETANRNYKEYDNALGALDSYKQQGLEHDAAVGITRLRYSERTVCEVMKLKPRCDIAADEVLAGHDWKAAVAACVWLDIDGAGKRYLFQATCSAGVMHEKALRLAESGQVAPEALLEMQTVLAHDWLQFVSGDEYQDLQARALDLMEAGKLTSAEQLPTKFAVRSWNETDKLDKLFDCLERGGNADLFSTVFSEDYYVYRPEQAETLLDALALGIDPTGWSDPQGFTAEDMRDMLCEAKKSVVEKPGRTDSDGFGRMENTPGVEKGIEGQEQIAPGREKGGESQGRRPGEMKSAGKPPKPATGEGCGCTPDSDARAACGSVAARTGSFVSVETAKDKGKK